MKLCMYVDNVLVDSVEMIPLPSDTRYMQGLLKNLWRKNLERLGSGQPEFLIEDVPSCMNALRQYVLKPEGYRVRINGRMIKDRRRKP